MYSHESTHTFCWQEEEVPDVDGAPIEDSSDIDGAPFVSSVAVSDIDGQPLEADNEDVDGEPRTSATETCDVMRKHCTLSFMKKVTRIKRR